jgi:hypothetical protein
MRQGVAASTDSKKGAKKGNGLSHKYRQLY